MVTFMMKVNGNGSERGSELDHKYHNLYMDETANEMLESDSASLACRVTELEAKCARQAEELLCLRSTLADALRRLSLLEATSGQVSRSPASSIPSTMYRACSSGQMKEIRIRQSSFRSQAESEQGKKTNSFGSNNSSTSTQRRSSQHQSSGSLHSDSPASSSSLSPAPSPSPRATPAPQAFRSRNNSTSSNQGNNVTSSSGSTLNKRWNSTGDFNSQGLIASNRFSTKSLLNLHSKPSQNGPSIKHGTHTCQYNDEEGTVRMYLRGRPIIFHAPTDVIEGYDLSKVAPPPHNKLKLDWVYGYRGKDCRSNLYLLPTGEIVYFVAAVVVLFNVDEQCQRHYTGHTDDVQCLSVHPNKLIIATGQCAGHDRAEARAHIRVWNSVSLATLCVLGAGDVDMGVSCITFSRADGGNLLAAVDSAPDHTITVWEWQREHKITETRCSADTVVEAEFHPLDANQIVTCGKSHIAFWTLDKTGMLYKRMGIFEAREKPNYVTCLGFNQNGDILTGDSNGNIIIWGRGTNTIIKLIRSVHAGSVFSICCMKDGSILTAGGKDGRIVQFDSQLNPTGIENVIESHYGGVRVVTEGRGDQVFIGTTRNCILMGDLQLGFSPAVLGHAEEVWGLAVHPSLPQFVSAGRDRLLQLWDALSHSTVWSKDIGERAQSCAYSNDGAVVAVGCLDGKWMVIDPTSREILVQNCDGKEPIQALQFSPDSSVLAVGSRDNFVYIYQITDNYKRFSRLGKCVGHSSFITHLDWSENGQYLRTNSGDYEMLYWNPRTCRQITSPSSLRDVTWHTSTCTLTFNTIGLWPEGADGTDVNACAAAHNVPLVASADDFGKVKLYSYPAAQPKSLSSAYGGHSSHVTCVRWTSDDQRLLTTGGADTAVLQWAVE